MSQRTISAPDAVPAPPDSPFATAAEEVLRRLDVRPEAGLTSGEARRRRERFGANELRRRQPRDILGIAADQFRSVVVGLLVMAAVIALLFGDLIEAAAIIAVIVINAAIGFFTELRAVRSMEALRALGQVDVRVRRDSEVRELSADELVPGDIVLIEGGDIVTADMRLFEASRLEVDESALTGESVPVAKQTEALGSETPLPERTNLVFKGTSVSRGAGSAVVVATGLDTELGKISTLVEEAEAAETPLQKRLDAMGRRMVWLTLGIAVLVAVAVCFRAARHRSPSRSPSRWPSPPYPRGSLSSPRLRCPAGCGGWPGARRSSPNFRRSRRWARPGSF